MLSVFISTEYFSYSFYHRFVTVSSSLYWLIDDFQLIYGDHSYTHTFILKRCGQFYSRRLYEVLMRCKMLPHLHSWSRSVSQFNRNHFRFNMFHRTYRKHRDLYWHNTAQSVISLGGICLDLITIAW